MLLEKIRKSEKYPKVGRSETDRFEQLKQIVDDMPTINLKEGHTTGDYYKDLEHETQDGCFLYAEIEGHTSYGRAFTELEGLHREKLGTHIQVRYIAFFDQNDEEMKLTDDQYKQIEVMLIAKSERL